ncbi:MAG: activase [Deltaproteobacteria bacterium]|nr:activase [Deltaproteobacteria bacterium]
MNASRFSLGIDVGSTNVKACLLKDGQEEWSAVRAHDGNLKAAVHALLAKHELPPGVPTLVTGQESRRAFRIASVIAPVAIERALGELGLDAGAVVSVGGEDLVVYTMDGSRHIVSTFAGNKCASGTGEFFAQQLKRMNLKLDSVLLPETANAQVCRLSARCSVFMKSDCTHKLNKGEANKHDIVLSLSNVMAKKVLEFLAKAHIESGRVLLVGGATRNPQLVKFVREGLPTVEIVVPEQASYLEAFGAAYLAAEQGQPLPALEDLLGEAQIIYNRERPLAQAEKLVTFVPPRRAPVKAGQRYVLGVDGGSTTTKVALIDMETREIVAAHYGRTLGDPVAALKSCLQVVRDQVREALGPKARPDIRLVATTGSSRELLGVFCQTSGIYNEIIAHTVGTTFYDKDIDTVFEIGGQDAKYVHLRNRVPVDYAMNEACSAGTGSFLEESAAGDLDIHKAEEIGPIALQATAPLKFGEHCSAFINSDIRKAIQQGATKPDITAGLVLSIVSNYLNRVVGNRRVGEHIVLQGGVAKNPAVPLAFALLLNKKVIVPPEPELMGCFGVGLLALEKRAEGALEEQGYQIDELIERQIVYEKEYRCKACDNDCPIRILKVNQSRYHFGGRCNKYANLRRKPVDTSHTTDFVEVRRQLYFEKYAPSPEELARGGVTVGVPLAFSVHSLWPLYSNFFHALGAKVLVVDRMDEKGAARCESSFCYPAEIAHAMTASLLETKADYYFLPHFKAMPSYEKESQACLCPIMQGEPYYLRTAFRIDDRKILRPLVDFTQGFAQGREPMLQAAVQMGFSRGAAEHAFSLAVERQESCYREGRRLGKKILEESKESERPVIVLCGRPYNAFADEANMGIPRKFITRGYTVVPYDFLPVHDEEIFPNMYWYYGQQDLKAATVAKHEKNLFACYVTNFSCAPDSFILHFLRWVSNTKPFLVLELDSHTADAGVDTRIEAFLDIIEGYRRAQVKEEPMMVERDWDVRIEGKEAFVVHRTTREQVPIKSERVLLLWPSMGNFATDMVVGTANASGIPSVALRPADITTAQRARAVASGKECIPALLVLGAFLEYFAENPIDREKIYLLFMPLTTGPCRTGQYAIFYQNLFQELGYKNVVVLSLNCDNSYSELGPDANKRAWWAFVLADYMRDIDLALRALAVDKAQAKRVMEEIGKEMVAAVAVGPAELAKRLDGWGERLARIPVRKPLSQARKVLIVGEIFVRRDDFSVDPLLDQLTEREIVPKIAGFAEWVHYLDYEQVRKLKKNLAALPWGRRLLAADLRKLALLKAEMLWKKHVEHKIHKALDKSRLIPELEEDMSFIMSRADEFTTPELESEATLSPVSAATAVEQGWDGVAVIAPFACLPGRLIEALYAPWSRERGIPVISLENDGNPYPPNVISRIEIFAHNVSRGMRGHSPSPKLSVPPPQPAALDQLALVAVNGNGHGNGNTKRREAAAGNGAIGPDAGVPVGIADPKRNEVR